MRKRWAGTIKLKRVGRKKAIRWLSLKPQKIGTENKIRCIRRRKETRGVKRRNGGHPTVKKSG